MALIVQKYGGTSLASAEGIRAVAGRSAARKEQGDDVVAVVSAMGDTTDQLIALAGQITEHPDDRELDVLLSTGEIVSRTLVTMALPAAGGDAVSLTGAQAGLRTAAAPPPRRPAQPPGRPGRPAHRRRPPPRPHRRHRAGARAQGAGAGARRHRRRLPGDGRGHGRDDAGA